MENASRKFVRDNITFHNADCLDVLPTIADDGVDAVITDPPYGILQHKLDIPFKEKKFFAEIKRILKPSGFVVLFGRGESFYRWNNILSNLGFIFSEEIIWDKKRNSNPNNSLLRYHETVSIFKATKNAKLQKSFIPYIEVRKANLVGIENDLKRILSFIRKPQNLEELNSFIEGEKLKRKEKRNRTEQSPFGVPPYRHERALEAYQSLARGMIERSIISIDSREYAKRIHPTQKPVRLIERLMNLVVPEKNKNAVVADFFSGSGTTAIAAMRTGRKFIGAEIDEQYFNAAVERIEHEEK